MKKLYYKPKADKATPTRRWKIPVIFILLIFPLFIAYSSVTSSKEESQPAQQSELATNTENTVDSEPIDEQPSEAESESESDELSTNLITADQALEDEPEVAEEEEQIETNQPVAESEESVPQSNHNISQSLQTALTDISNEFPVQLSYRIVDLNNGEVFELNPQRQHVAASLYKLFVVYEIYKQIEAEEMSYDDIVPKADLPVSTCINRAIRVSDNACAKFLGEMYGWVELESTVKSLGYTSTRLNNYFPDGSYDGDKYTTAHDVSKLLQNLSDSKGISNTSQYSFIGHLHGQQMNSTVPVTPPGFSIAHKTGEIYSVVSDAGYLYTPTTVYSYVIITDGWDNRSHAAPYLQSILSSIIEAES